MPDRWLPTSDLHRVIATQIQQFVRNDLPQLPPAMRERLLRVEVPIAWRSPLTWLRQQPAGIKTYWVDRDRGFAMAGIGALDIIAGDRPIQHDRIFQRIRKYLSPLYSQIRYYGGISFEQTRAIDPSWQQFGNYRFIVPKFEVCLRQNRAYFACNFRLSPQEKEGENWQIQLEQIWQELAEINFEPNLNADYLQDLLPLLISRTDLPDRVSWYRNLDLALKSFDRLDLDKIVLARRSKLQFTAPLEPQALLLALQPHNPHSYHFCFQLNPKVAFIGTSPERLYARQDRLLQTEAIAGTRPRGKSSQIDRELSDNLLNSSKDIHEHQLVVQNLHSILDRLCDSVEIDRQLGILKLSKVQHLYTHCHGTLKAHINDADILPKLHPTPAVGGFPKPQALQLIQELEPFERGWYAAPVGWVGYDSAEFAVAIRSGLIDRDRLLLFSGAGIVRGSQPEEEWAEINNKIRHFTDLFTDAPPQKNPDSLIIAS
jgi:menaquinone-specific isochorismate synthase